MPDTKTSVFGKEFKINTPRALYFLIFTVSGFSGLIYESIWSHYLKLFLGHAAYAQSLVLIIFMGGLAVGSWLASRFSAKSRSPLLIYAAVEFIVGIAALLFHNVFTSTIEVFYNSILPSIGSPFAGATLKWLAASILIVPQSILLGMTFPIMSAGIIRRYPDAPGGSIAMLYFTNSIGAALGVLASGFWLIKLVGLPGTIVTAGLLNIALALAVWILVRLDASPETAPIKSEPTSDERSSLKRLFLIAAFITGAASFMYEISWIRMLSLVLGATTHSFELMLSAFITGLAFGGLWIKRRIDRIASPVRFSGYVQLIMGALALLTIPVYVASFGWMEWLLRALDLTDAGYTGYTLASHAIAMSVMLPATFMAGMTLPLFTFVLLREGQGEASIGQVYAANTIGAIVGVLATVHIGLPMLGLKGAIVVGALLDVCLGLVLLSRGRQGRERSFELATAGAVSLATLAVTVAVVDVDPKLLISGVYRTGTATLPADAEVVFYQDGKTSSVSLVARESGMVILSTNGKPDASIQINPDAVASADEITMVIAAALPIAYMPDAKNIANIGMGSGLTTHAILAHEGVEKVDTIEIEPAMVAAAKGYGEVVERAFADARSTIHIEDAKTYFSLHNSIYDIIITEPSNPWVSGVASLFSSEFYKSVRHHLVDDGLFVQWIQIYEFDDLLMESILKALSENFSDYVIYATDGTNLLLIARNHGELPEPDWSAIFGSGMKTDLARVDVQSESDMKIRKIFNRDTLVPYLKRSTAPVNSDYFPFVDLHAGQARFKQTHSTIVEAWMMPPMPVFEMLSKQLFNYEQLTSVSFLPRVAQAQRAKYMFQRLTDDKHSVTTSDIENGVVPTMHYLVELMRNEMHSCNPQKQWPALVPVLHDIMVNTLPFMSIDKGVLLVDTIAASSCAVHDPGQMSAWIELYRAVARRDGSGMSAAASFLLSEEANTPEVFYEYLIDAAMLGYIVAGDGQAALEIWNRTGKELMAGWTLASHTELLLSIALDSQASVATETKTASR
jgi:predicted membrane-bound spermidine synthase